MKLLAIILLSLALAGLLCYGAMWAAETIARLQAQRTDVVERVL